MGSVSVDKRTLTSSKTESVGCFLIVQFNSEVYCNLIKLDYHESKRSNQLEKIKEFTDAVIQSFSSK